ASQKPSRPASKASAIRVIVRPALTASGPRTGPSVGVVPSAKVRGFSRVASAFPVETDWLLEEPGFDLVVPVGAGTIAEPLWYLDLDSGINDCGAGQVCVEARARIEPASDEQTNQQALSLVHSASFAQPARIRYSAS